MNDIVPSIGVVVFEGEKVLLVWKKNHTRKMFQLPGGQIEPEETLEDAALRELYETAGLKGDAAKLIVLPNEWQARIEKSYGTKVFSLKCVVCEGYKGSIEETRSAIPIWAERSKLGSLNLEQNTLAAVEAAESRLV